MKAIRINQFGSPNVLEYVECQPPTMTDGQLLIAVAAAAVNPIDFKIRQGSHMLCPMLSMPTGIGYDFTGTIMAGASEADAYKEGDWVVGIAGFPAAPCACQEQIAIDPGTCIKVDNNIASPELAALPVAGLTAWQAVHAQAQIQPGQRVLIHAGAGGVGIFAIQLAKLAGAYVLTTASSGKHSLLKALGADECIDYSKDNSWHDLSNIDAVIDLVGGQTGLDSIALCDGQSVLVTVPSMSAKEILAAAESKGVKAKHFMVDCQMSDLQQLVDLYGEGKLRIIVAESLPLSQAASAHEMIESQRTTGKILLMMS